MDKLFFTTVAVSSSTDDNQLFYLSEEEARKETEAAVQEEIRNIQKLIHDCQLDMPILTRLLKSLSVSISVREYALCEAKAS